MFLRISTSACALMAFVVAASAADFSAPAVIPYTSTGGLPVMPWSWTGGYIGAHMGSSEARAKLSNPMGQLAGTGSLFGDNVVAPGGLAGLQAGYNWQVPDANWVIGLEGALSIVDGKGSNTCLTENAILVSANCTYSASSMGTVAARLGYAFGPDDRILAYGKVGGGFVGEHAYETNNYDGQVLGSRTKSLLGGAYLVGAGLEYALTPSISFNLEYEHYGISAFSEPTNFYWTHNGVQVYQSMHNRPSLDVVKFGVNYHFDDNSLVSWAATAQPDPLPGVEVEVGTRYWYSAGKFQKDLPASNASSTSLVSRLTYQDKANSGELFGKVESQNLYLRGSVADGRLSSGKLNDEDWLGTSQGPSIPYSNTLSTLRGTASSAILDLGYDVVNNASGKLSPSIGYAYLYEQRQASGCTQQTSLQLICGPGQVQPGELGITETDYWNGLRLGLSGEMLLAPGLRLSADVAYLPYVSFHGTDNHWLRSLVFKESGRGQGTQLQAVLTYDVTPQFSVGAGARYWALWANAGTDQANGVPQDRTDTYRTQRAGAFLQGSYKFAAK